MKNIKNITALSILSTFLLGGCGKFLERDNPTGITDERFWRVENELTNYLNTIYVNEMPGGALNGDMYQANSLMQMSGITDEAVSRTNFGTWQNFPVGLLTPSDPYISDIYRYNYANISDCSRILENYQNVYIADATLKNRYAAEARALRAYAHLKLYEFFGPVPIVKRSMQFSDPEANNLPRPKEEDLVAFISKELDTAAVDLPVSYNVDEAYRMSKGACYGLQVRLYLNNKNYPKVIEYAKKIMDLNIYNLWKAPGSSKFNNYASLFSYEAQNNNERIIYRRAGNKGIAGRFGPASVVANGQATISPTSGLIDIYETKQGKTLAQLPIDSINIYKKTPNYKQNRDPRLAATILLPGASFVKIYEPFNNPTDLLGNNFATVTGALAIKYLQPEDYNKGFGGATMNFMIMRYAEILLSYVEALVESGDWQNPDVKKYINQIRNRAGLPNYDENLYNSQSRIRELYRRERFVELALEGTRLMDIRRWKIGTEVLNGPAYGLIDPRTGQIIKVEDRVFNPKRDYLWPIPQTEINNNKGLNGQNNPGW